MDYGLWNKNGRIYLFYLRKAKKYQWDSPFISHVFRCCFFIFILWFFSHYNCIYQSQFRKVLWFCYQNAGIPDKQHVVLVITLTTLLPPKSHKSFLWTWTSYACIACTLNTYQSSASLVCAQTKRATTKDCRWVWNCYPGLWGNDKHLGLFSLLKVPGRLFQYPKVGYKKERNRLFSKVRTRGKRLELKGFLW